MIFLTFYGSIADAGEFLCGMGAEWNCGRYFSFTEKHFCEQDFARECAKKNLPQKPKRPRKESEFRMPTQRTPTAVMDDPSTRLKPPPEPSASPAAAKPESEGTKYNFNPAAKEVERAGIPQNVEIKKDEPNAEPKVDSLKVITPGGPRVKVLNGVPPVEKEPWRPALKADSPAEAPKKAEPPKQQAEPPKQAEPRPAPPAVDSVEGAREPVREKNKVELDANCISKISKDAKANAEAIQNKLKKNLYIRELKTNTTYPFRATGRTARLASGCSKDSAASSGNKYTRCKLEEQIKDPSFKVNSLGQMEFLIGAYSLKADKVCLVGGRLSLYGKFKDSAGEEHSFEFNLSNYGNKTSALLGFLDSGSRSEMAHFAIDASSPLEPIDNARGAAGQTSAPQPGAR